MDIDLSEGLESLKQQFIKKYGLDDDEAAQQAGLGWSNEIHEGAQSPGGLYEQLNDKGYHWSHEAQKWFCQWQQLPPREAFIIQLMIVS